MKKTIALTILSVITVLTVLGQEDNSVIDAPLGLRIEKNGQDYLIYADKNLSLNFNDYRKLNYQVYFRKVDFPEKEEDGKKYQLITIPGSSNKQNQDEIKSLADETVIYPRAGKTVSK